MESHTGSDPLHPLILDIISERPHVYPNTNEVLFTVKARVIKDESFPVQHCAYSHHSPSFPLHKISFRFS